MARLVLFRSPQGELGVEYNAANLRAQTVYSTLTTAQVCVITLDGGTFVRQETDSARPVPIPGSLRLIQTSEGLDLPGVTSISFGAL